MRKYVLALLVAVAAVTGAHALTGDLLQPGDCVSRQTCVTTLENRWNDVPNLVLAQATPKSTTSVETSAPVTSTTVVKGGNLAAQILEWFQVAFGGAIATAVLVIMTRVFSYFGVQTTQLQRQQLQSVIVNGLNAAAAKAQTSLRDSRSMDIEVKNKIVQDAVSYAQDHASETIKALGLDPKSGDAVDAIRARIETALNDPQTPTPAAITPVTGGGSLSQLLAPRSA